MTALQSLRVRAESVIAQSHWARLGGAAAIALAAVAIRGALGPVLGPGAYYFLYYPIVLLVAYGLGVWPSLLCAGIVAATSYVAFVSAAGDGYANLRFALFVVSAGAMAVIGAHVRTQLQRVDEEMQRTQDLTRGQAELFREHAARVSDHLQLLAGLLQMRIDNEPSEDDYARALMNAASRTMLISRLHRSFAGADGALIEFSSFAQRLADAALAAQDRAGAVVSVDGALMVEREPATSLALVLLECLKAGGEPNASVSIAIALDQGGNEGAMTVTEAGVGENAWRRRDTRLLNALVEQMRGRLVLGSANGRAMLRLAFPTQVQPLPAWRPLAPLN